MNFETTENQKMIRQSVKDFAEKHIRPYVMEWDEKQEAPNSSSSYIGIGEELDTKDHLNRARGCARQKEG